MVTKSKTKKFCAVQIAFHVNKDEALALARGVSSGIFNGEYNNQLVIRTKDEPLFDHGNRISSYEVTHELNADALKALVLRAAADVDERLHAYWLADALNNDYVTARLSKKTLTWWWTDVLIPILKPLYEEHKKEEAFKAAAREERSKNALQARIDDARAFLETQGLTVVQVESKEIEREKELDKGFKQLTDALGGTKRKGSK